MIRSIGTMGRLGGPLGARRLALAVVLTFSVQAAWAQTPQAEPAPATPNSSTPASPNPPGPALSPVTPLPTTPATPSGSPPPSSPPAGTPPSTAPSPAPKPDGTTSTEDRQPADSSISSTLDLPAHPAVILSGQSTWDNGFKSITDSFAKLTDAMGKAKVGGVGHPLAVFTETDDSGFKFTAMIPIEKVPDAKPDLGSGIAFGETPGGKAMRFQHRGAYDDIDSTYEAITAYLDEKGLESKNLFAEEYLHPVKTSDDNALEVDIYVFLK